ncbi:MAG TPA: hypothetical protein VM221_01015 [Armatimonadota bacterium]|nr:hypothetical protein [Armatimonadota bacterium]
MAQQRSTRGRKRLTPAIGDEVRVPADTRNQFSRYEHFAATEWARQPIDGLVVSIREISSGQPVKVAAGPARRYVFDLLHDRTFDLRVSSKGNSQGATAGRPQRAQAFALVQRALRQLAGRSAPASGGDALAGPPLQELLDGWRLVRVCADDVEVREPGAQE